MERNQLVIYNVHKEVAIDVFYGRKNIFIGSEGILNDEDKLLFHVKHNWFYRTGEEEPSEKVCLNHENGMHLRVGEFTLLLLNDMLLETSYKDTVPQTDLVYLYNISFLSEEIIADFTNRNVRVIMGDSLGWKLKKYLISKIEPDNLHQLKEDGAFIQAF